MKRRFLLITLAVVLAAVGTIGVFAYVRGADKRAADNGKPVAVVIAIKRIAAGTTWKDARHSGDLTVQHMSASTTPAQALTSLDVGIAEDSVAQSDIAPGTPVLRQVFGPATSQTGVIAIPKGMIAVTIGISSSSDDVAGYVQPKSQVAVFVTARLKVNKSGKSTTVSNGGASGTGGSSSTGDDNDLIVTRTVVPRALVIATSQASPTSLVASDNSSTTTASADQTVQVTLALTQKDAERVINQQNVGRITLALLSADSQISQDGGYVNAGVFRTQPTWPE
jgi:pilus assembly protein CpaB